MTHTSKTEVYMSFTALNFQLFSSLLLAFISSSFTSFFISVRFLLSFSFLFLQLQCFRIQKAFSLSSQGHNRNELDVYICLSGLKKIRHRRDEASLEAESIKCQ